jgi:hypothetical protein
LTLFAKGLFLLLSKFVVIIIKYGQSINIMEVARVPSDDDKLLLQEIAREFLGAGAIANFMNARTRGVIGDNPHYAYSVVATYPGLWSKGHLALDYEKIEQFAHEVSSRLDMAGNVTIDVTPPTSE